MKYSDQAVTAIDHGRDQQGKAVCYSQDTIEGDNNRVSGSSYEMMMMDKTGGNVLTY